MHRRQDISRIWWAWIAEAPVQEMQLAGTGRCCWSPPLEAVGKHSTASSLNMGGGPIPISATSNANLQHWWNAASNLLSQLFPSLLFYDLTIWRHLLPVMLAHLFALLHRLVPTITATRLSYFLSCVIFGAHWSSLFFGSVPFSGHSWS